MKGLNNIHSFSIYVLESDEINAATSKAQRSLNIMKIYIPTISDSTTRRDMREFVNTVLEKWFRLPFSAQPRIVSCQIIVTENSMGVKQRNGLLNIIPDDAAMRIIRKLNGKQLKGKHVGVKQYHRAPEELPIQHI